LKESEVKIMNEQKKKRYLPLKEILFSYLALSKIFYWFSIIAEAEQRDFLGMARAFWTRFVERDVMLVAAVILFFALEKFIMKKSKGSNVFKQFLMYAIGYVGMLGLMYLYMLVLSLFFEIVFTPLIDLVAESIVGYILIAIALNIKIYFKSKEKETYKAAQADLGTSDDLAMLESLFEKGILTQEEFDSKRAGLPEV